MQGLLIPLAEFFKIPRGKDSSQSEAYFSANSSRNGLDSQSLIDTGLYRRIQTNPGFVEINGNLVNPLCSASNIPANPPPTDQDTGYVYTGGTSAANVPIDAGLQWSPLYNDYESYYLYKKARSNLSDRWKCGTGIAYSIGMEFYVVSPTTLLLEITGKPDRANQPSTIMYVIPNVIAADGWSSSGGTQTLKRVVSLAQKTTEYDGYYFGILSKTNQTPTLDLQTWALIGATGSGPLSASNSSATNFPANDPTRVIVTSDGQQGMPLSEKSGLYAHK